MSAPDGLLVLDKPGGWTSHDAVARVRRLAGTRRVGHAGTLDPMATGVLVLGIGRATRLLGHLALTTKRYAATIRLGIATVTDDAEGEVTASCDASGVTDAALREGIGALTGPLRQVPSSVSAVKVNGVRSYARVRAGEEVTLAPRDVVVARFDLLDRRKSDVDVVVECSSGTYIRALARDLGAGLGVGAHLLALRRERVGTFGLADAVALDGLTDQDLARAVIGLDAAAAMTFPRRELSLEEAVQLSHGRSLATGAEVGEDVVAAFAPDGRCMALLHDDGTVARPTVVFAPAGS